MLTMQGLALYMTRHVFVCVKGQTMLSVRFVLPSHGQGLGPSLAKRPPCHVLQSTAQDPPLHGSAGNDGRCDPASFCGPPTAPLAQHTVYQPGLVSE